MDYMKKRWTVVAASCIVNVFIGISYCWSIFQSGFMSESEEIFGATVVASSLALAFTFNTGVGPITMITGGAMKKKFGAGGVIKIGAVLTLLGLLMTGMAHSVPMVWIGFGIIAGFGVGMINGITTTNTGLWFPEMRGTIAGLTTAFICGFFISAPPEGWLPDGYVPPAPKKNGPAPRNYSWNEMIRDKRYYVAVIAFLCFSSAGLFVIQSATGMAKTIGGLPKESALVAYTVSFIGIANSGGRLLWGAISDKIGRYKALMAMGCLVAISGFCLSRVNQSYGMFLIFAMLIAACYGGSMGVYPALTADNFGPKNNGINYGIMFIGFALGGYVGPKFFTSLMEQSGGSYAMPLTIVGAFGIVAIVLIFLLVKFRESMK